ncbi:MAG: hypothetical protein J6N49_02500 [Alphaproteobacteria bacterium]|nr:hypothetical protein [Alphaproteobacteria bacterium]
MMLLSVLILGACSTVEHKHFCYNAETEQWDETHIIAEHNNTVPNKILKVATFPLVLAVDTVTNIGFIPVYIVSFGNSKISDIWWKPAEKMQAQWRQIDEDVYKCENGNEASVKEE